MNTEYEIWNLMYLGFISNAMFMVAMVLLSWLGFRFAAAIAADPETPVMGKNISNYILSSRRNNVLQHCANWRSNN